MASWWVSASLVEPVTLRASIHATYGKQRVEQSSVVDGGVQGRCGCVEGRRIVDLADAIRLGEGARS